VLCGHSTQVEELLYRGSQKTVASTLTNQAGIYPYPMPLNACGLEPAKLATQRCTAAVRGEWPLTWRLEQSMVDRLKLMHNVH